MLKLFKCFILGLTLLLALSPCFGGDVIFTSVKNIPSMADVDGKNTSFSFSIYNGKRISLPRGSYSLRVQNALVHGIEYNPVLFTSTIKEVSTIQGLTYCQTIKRNYLAYSWATPFEVTSDEDLIVNFEVPFSLIEVKSEVTNIDVLK